MLGPGPKQATPDYEGSGIQIVIRTLLADPNIFVLFCFPDDDSNAITSAFDQEAPVPTKTTWTLLLYLTSEADGCRGGETVFFPNDRRVAKEEVAVPPEAGMVLLHKHGDDCMMVSLLARCPKTHIHTTQALAPHGLHAWRTGGVACTRT